jgi:hypothetical protein
MKIIGFAGKKQSGKNTASNFLVLLTLLEQGISEHARLNEHGEIEVSDIFGQKVADQPFFPFKEPYVRVKQLFANELGSHIKIYAYADFLKEIAINLFGLSYEQVYGTDEDKNTFTKIRWENMPGVVDDKIVAAGLQSGKIMYHKKGRMTAREFLQFFGTDICRKISNTCWVDYTINKIQQDNPALAIISDVRFINEINAIKDKNGFVIYLTRASNATDQHPSEQDIKDIKVCNAVLDNQDMTIPQQNEALFTLLQKHGILSCQMV